MDGEGGRKFPRSLELRNVAPALALSALSAVVVVLNLRWVHVHRRGLPVNIDEAAYLEHALRDADALHQGGLTALWNTVRYPYVPHAPLLPLTGAFWRLLTNAGPVGLIGIQDAYAVVAVVATYLVARSLSGRPLSALVAASCTAALPGVIDGGHGFLFALPAAALTTAALASQLVAADFQRLRWSAAWGILLGLATLTRVVMLALLPALVAAAVLRLALRRACLQQWVNLAIGLVVASLVALTWYEATWRAAWNYLTSYGYGRQAADYGQPRPLLSWHTWTFRLGVAMNTEVYLPLSIAGAVCLAVALGRLVRRHPSRRRASPDAVARFLGSGWGTVTVVLVIDYVLLSTTRNVGNDFELPLLPAAAALLVAAATVGGRAGRIIASGTAATAVLFSVVAGEGLLPGGSPRRTVSRGSLEVVAYDVRGPLLSYSQDFLPARAGGTEALLRQWERSGARLANRVLASAAKRGQPMPVVFFAAEDPFVNTSSFELLAAQRGVSITAALLVPPRAGGDSYVEQLRSAASRAAAVLVIPSANQEAEAFPPRTRLADVRRAAHVDGYRRFSDVTEPGGRYVELWWRGSSSTSGIARVPPAYAPVVSGSGARSIRPP